MIPVSQTRYAVETLGNCFEACIASILELPLSAIPDRRDYLDDADGWADLVQRTRREKGEKAVGELDLPTGSYEAWETDLHDWLRDRGLNLLELDIADQKMRDAVLPILWKAGYWIGTHRNRARGWAHAVVHLDSELVWDPTGAKSDLGECFVAHLLTAADPPLIARRLGPELLPDVAGEIESLHRSKVPTSLYLEPIG